MAGLLKKYVIFRDIPKIGEKSSAELASVSKASCDALRAVGTDQVQWQHSFVTNDRTYCVYLATSEDAVRKHAEAGGIPITSVEEVKTVIDPTTANYAVGETD